MGFEVLFLALALPTAISLLLKRSNIRRLLLTAVVFAFEGRYLAWRLGTFPWGNEQNGAEWFWWLLVLAIELAVIIEVTLFLFTISWLTDRTGLADQAERKLRERYASAGKSAIPSVDLLITTYNEGPEVLEKSILGAS
jgi:cellulose synthase (UDP-forming)